MVGRPGTTRRTVERKILGTVGEMTLRSQNGGTRGGGAGGCAKRVCTWSGRCRHGRRVAQRGVSDAESVGGDEVRETRRRNSPSDPTSREIEDHVLTGHASFRSWCAACVQGPGRAERHQGEAAKSLRMVRRSQSYRGITVSLEPETEPVKRRWNSVRQSRPGDARWSHQVNFCSFDSRERS